MFRVSIILVCTNLHSYIGNLNKYIHVKPKKCVFRRHFFKTYETFLKTCPRYSSGILCFHAKHNVKPLNIPISFKFQKCFESFILTLEQKSRLNFSQAINKAFSDLRLYKISCLFQSVECIFLKYVTFLMGHSVYLRCFSSVSSIHIHFAYYDLSLLRYPWFSRFPDV